MAYISNRQFNVLGKTAIDLPADHTRMVITQIIASPVTPPAVATGQIVVHVHPIPRLEAVDRWTDLSHVARDFVTDDAGELATRATTAVTVPNQGQAEAARPDS